MSPAALGSVLLAFVPFLHAQAVERIGAAPTGIEEAAQRLPVVFEGIVFDPDGAPAADAVVMSSAGGSALTDASGAYRLAVDVPVDAQSVEITAVGGMGGQLVAQRSVGLSGGARIVRLQPLELSQQSASQPSWLPTFGGDPGPLSRTQCLAVFDDGGGPELYVGGAFDQFAGQRAFNIAKWDGSRWWAVGAGIGNASDEVRALAVFDDGHGPALYAAGDFAMASGVAANNIAKWDGSSWSAVGSGPIAQGAGGLWSLAVFDDGSGPALFAGFSASFSIPIKGIAKWNGSSWSAVGSGLNGWVSSMVVHDDGSGPALFAAGDIHSSGTISLKDVAKWNGSSWSAVGSGLNGFVNALAVFDDGNGPALYAGGGGLGVPRLSKWNGSSWTSVGGPIGSEVFSLRTLDDGGGSALFVGGNLESVGGISVNNVAKWNGSSWAPLGNGIGVHYLDRVDDLLAFDDGSGTAIYAAGRFEDPGGFQANKVVRWDGSIWTGVGNGFSGRVNDVVEFDDGTGPAFYVGGKFETACGVEANGIARWDGASWNALGSGVENVQYNDEVKALAIFDDGSGAALYAGGNFDKIDGVPAKRIAKWDGSRWRALGNGLGININIDDEVNALAVFDDGGGPALYAGGEFQASGFTTARRFAKWNGSSWSDMGNVNNVVHALAVFDDGRGPALYVAGAFTATAGVQAKRLARWDGSSWSALGSGLDGPVSALAVFDDGTGAALYAGGNFTSAGGVPASCIAKWDGSSWSSLGTGIGGTSSNRVSALTVLDDSFRPALFAGGTFALAGGVAANHVARWDGSSWSPLAQGMAAPTFTTVPEVRTLEAFNDRTGLALFAGGFFTQAGDSGDSYFAKWGSPDTTAPVIACPAPIVIDDRLGNGLGESVTYSVIVKDEQDPAPTLVCLPPSGSRFPRGTTLVNCTVTDFSGNQTSCTFTVTVVGTQVPAVPLGPR